MRVSTPGREMELSGVGDPRSLIPEPSGQGLNRALTIPYEKSVDPASLPVTFDIKAAGAVWVAAANSSNGASRTRIAAYP